jgi:hypothetical protein
MSKTGVLTLFHQTKWLQALVQNTQSIKLFADGASLTPSIGHYDSMHAPLSGRAPKLSPKSKPHIR